MKRVVVAVTLVLTGIVLACEPVAAQSAGYQDVVVSTLPPVAGVAVQYGDQVAATGADGSVTFQRSTDPAVPIPEVTVLDQNQVDEAGSVARFARVYGGGGTTPTIAFDIDYPVSFRFSDTNGDAVGPETIESLQLKSSVGEVIDVPPAATSMLQGKRVVPLNGDLLVKDLYWTVQTATVGGSNVVNRSQHRFLPAYDRTVDTPLLFFTARFHARDAFFQFSTGSEVELQYPNGVRRRLPIDGNGDTVVRGLPRGDYKVRVLGFGTKTWQPVSISRNQDLELKLLSWLDIGAVLLAGAGLALGLVMVGRHLRRRNYPLDLLDDFQITWPALRWGRSSEHRRPIAALLPGPTLSPLEDLTENAELVVGDAVLVSTNGEPIIDLRDRQDEWS